MDDILHVILEALLAGLGFLVYGTEDKPRHPAIRNTVRAIAFGGAAIAIAKWVPFIDNLDISIGYVIGWIVCFMIVLTAEYEIGSKRVAYAVFATTAVLAVLIVRTIIAS